MSSALVRSWARECYYVLEDEKKIFYHSGKRIGLAYEFVRAMIFKGLSSANAHDMIDKIREKQVAGNNI